MALAVTLDRKIADLKTIHIWFTVVASGNYAAGGEALGLKALAKCRKDPLSVVITGKAGFSYPYDYANDKMRVHVNDAGGVNAAQGEHTAVAYVAGITGDTIKGYAVFEKAL